MPVLKTGAVLAMALGVVLAISGRGAVYSSRGQNPVSNDTDGPKFKLDIMRKQADSGGSEEEDRHKLNDKIILHVQITNISTEKLTVPVLDIYWQNRPELVKNGQPVPYRKETRKLLDKRDANLEFSRRDYVTLQPAETKEVGPVNLSDWYGPLESGVYQLTIKYRLLAGGRWIVSAPITFEVVP